MYNHDDDYNDNIVNDDDIDNDNDDELSLIPLIHTTHISLYSGKA